MSKNLFKNPRKTIAIALVGLGLAGVSIASAATLLLEGGSNSLAQAGTTDLSVSECQDPEVPINVYYGLVDGDGHTAGYLVHGTGDVTDFGYIDGEEALVLDEIDEACGGKTINVALGDSDGALIASYAGVVPGLGGVLTLAGSDWTPGPAAGNLADIAKVSVTIYD